MLGRLAGDGSGLDALVEKVGETPTRCNRERGTRGPSRGYGPPRLMQVARKSKPPSRIRARVSRRKASSPTAKSIHSAPIPYSRFRRHGRPGRGSPRPRCQQRIRTSFNRHALVGRLVQKDKEGPLVVERQFPGARLPARRHLPNHPARKGLNLGQPRVNGVSTASRKNFRRRRGPLEVENGRTHSVFNVATTADATWVIASIAAVYFMPSRRTLPAIR